jgi:hypothetical protein
VQVIIDTEVNVRKYDLGEVRNGALGQVSAKREAKVNLHGTCVHSFGHEVKVNGLDTMSFCTGLKL